MPIPEEHLSLVERLRKYLGDTAEMNELLEREESSDEELYMALEDALDEMNHEFEPLHITWPSLQEAPWPVLRMGATLNVLTSKGINSARNTLSYNDGGNLQIRDIDQYGRYLNYYNILLSKFSRSVLTIKRSKNLDQAYGGVASEYWNLSE